MEKAAILEMIFNIIGGLGIFLFGMKNISEGMQAVAGEKLRRLINAVTNNRFVACGVGTAVTSVIQSSSVTTVIIVGMVNAGIMTLTQAIGVIFGANIGTTITAWILVIKISEYGLPILGLAAIIYLFSKNEKLRYTSLAALGLGMIFFGLELMKNGLAPLKGVPYIEEWFAKFTPQSYLELIKCVSVGAAITAILQSSSATIGITISLAVNGIIDYPTAAALVLGENIGTTITAYLASLGASTSAKRAAYAHILFNVIGVIIATSIFRYYIDWVQKVILWTTGHNLADTVLEAGQASHPYIGKAIAITHSCFNIFNTLLFLPFVKLLASLLTKIVPEKKEPAPPRLTSLEIRFLEAPALGIEQSQREIYRMGNIVMEMLAKLKAILQIDTPAKTDCDKIFQMERDLDVVQKEIVEFVSNIMTGSIPRDVEETGRKQLRMADEYESISDYIANILKLNLKLADTKQKITADGITAICDLHDRVAEYIAFINNSVRTENEKILKEANENGRLITNLMKKYRAEHIARVEKGLASPLKSLIYTDMLNSYRRIKDHGLNIAEVLAGEK